MKVKVGFPPFVKMGYILGTGYSTIKNIGRETKTHILIPASKIDRTLTIFGAQQNVNDAVQWILQIINTQAARISTDHPPLTRQEFVILEEGDDEGPAPQHHHADEAHSQLKQSTQEPQHIAPRHQQQVHGGSGPAPLQNNLATSSPPHQSTSSSMCPGRSLAEERPQRNPPKRPASGSNNYEPNTVMHKQLRMGYEHERHMPSTDDGSERNIPSASGGSDATLDMPMLQEGDREQYQLEAEARIPTTNGAEPKWKAVSYLKTLKSTRHIDMLRLDGRGGFHGFYHFVDKPRHTHCRKCNGGGFQALHMEINGEYVWTVVNPELGHKRNDCLMPEDKLIFGIERGQATHQPSGTDGGQVGGDQQPQPRTSAQQMAEGALKGLVAAEIMDINVFKNIDLSAFGEEEKLHLKHAVKKVKKSLKGK